jgi:hypothetical protein
MTDKFPRRHFFKHLLKEIGETSTNTLRSFHLEDAVEAPTESILPEQPARKVVCEAFAVPTNKPKRSL